MWKTNVDVLNVYATADTKNCWAIISGETGWKQVKQTSTDGVTNVGVILSAAKANSRKVHVYLAGGQITAAIMV